MITKLAKIQKGIKRPLQPSTPITPKPPDLSIKQSPPQVVKNPSFLLKLGKKKTIIAQDTSIKVKSKKISLLLQDT